MVVSNQCTQAQRGGVSSEWTQHTHTHLLPRQAHPTIARPVAKAWYGRSIGGSRQTKESFSWPGREVFLVWGERGVFLVRGEVGTGPAGGRPLSWSAGSMETYRDSPVAGQKRHRPGAALRTQTRRHARTRPRLSGPKEIYSVESDAPVRVSARTAPRDDRSMEARSRSPSAWLAATPGFPSSSPLRCEGQTTQRRSLRAARPCAAHRRVLQRRI